MGGHDISALAIDRTEFERRALLSSTVILDPRERDAFRRGHRDGAINIPGDELPVRARIELPLDKAVIVDCSHADEISCIIGATRLSDARFQVSVFR
jgi:rhodanese-related sulfurtransferase